MASIFETVTPVFLIILLGYLLGRLKKINVGPLVDLLVYVTVPALIISSITRSTLSLADFFTIALSAGGIIIIMGLAAFVLFRALKSKKTGLSLPMAIGNSGYLGYPIALLAFGVDGLSRAVVFDVVNSLFLYSLGIWIIHKKEISQQCSRFPCCTPSSWGSG